MIDKNKEFIDNFVAAAKESDDEKMQELAKTTSDMGIQDRVDLLEGLVAELNKTEANKEVEAGLAATLELMKLAVEAQASAEGEDKKDSTGEESKEHKHVGSKLDEVAEDATADTSADETEGERTEAEAGAAIETEVKSEGEAPAEEEEEEKTEANEDK